MNNRISHIDSIYVYYEIYGSTRGTQFDFVDVSQTNKQQPLKRGVFVTNKQDVLSCTTTFFHFFELTF